MANELRIDTNTTEKLIILSFEGQWVALTPDQAMNVVDEIYARVKKLTDNNKIIRLNG